MPGDILDIVTSPVTIVTARNKDRINGMTVAWIMQAAYNPACLAISIAPERFTHSLIKDSHLFGVNILADNQQSLGRHFGFASGRSTDKFKKIEYAKSKSGIPILKDIYAYIECKVVDFKNAGDHDLFIGRVSEKTVYNDKRPLIFKASDYF